MISKPTALLENVLTMAWKRYRALRYGENPHQEAAWYSWPQPSKFGFGDPSILQEADEKPFSFTNLLDLDAAARIMMEFDEPAACIIKHTNPCGAAVGYSIAEAYVRARDTDKLSAFGGVVGLNRAVDEETAREIVTLFTECLIAPAITADALRILKTKPKLRLIVMNLAELREKAADQPDFRSILGAVLVQKRDEVVEARSTWPTHDLKIVTKRRPTADEWASMRFGWRVMAHVKSNTVIFTDSQKTRAIGCGQMSRVDSVKLAHMKAAGWTTWDTKPLAGTTAASDAFFPFRDGVDAVAAAGATAIVQTGGSERDEETIAAADEHGMAMVFTGRRHFRH